VYAEALRVPLFQKACNEGGSDSEKLEKLGKLMDESQASCRYLGGVVYHTVNIFRPISHHGCCTSIISFLSQGCVNGLRNFFWSKLKMI